MTEISDGGPGLDSGAAAYADVPLDYLDTGRDHMARPIIAAHSTREAPPGGDPDPGSPEAAPDLSEAFDSAFALLIEHGDGGRTRRRLVVSLAAAERARRRAEDRGQWCRVAIVRLAVVAELDRAPRHGGGSAWPG